MIERSVLGTIAKDQLNEFQDLEDTVERKLLSRIISYGGSSAFIVKGIRRCGKSTLLKQIVKSKFPQDFWYFNFDDERLAGFTSLDFQPLLEVMFEIFGKKTAIFFDEIQNIAGWELFVNRLLREGFRVFLTGSNATLLSKELGTRLTGRHIDIELFPFSFSEFLKAKRIVPPTTYYSTNEKAALSRAFGEYFERGGLPEVVVFNNDTVLVHVLSDIVQKDIVVRYKVRDPRALRIIVNFLIANVANLITFRSLKDNFDFKSANTVQKYVQYLEETYVLFTVKRYEEKIKLLDKNPKKVYCMDNGLVSKNSPSIQDKRGVLLENLVALQLKRIGKEFFYFKSQNGAEADFVVPSESTAIQVCYELTPTNRDREIKGLIEASNKLKSTRLLIITRDQEEEIAVKDRKISVKPAWQWLLESEG